MHGVALGLAGFFIFFGSRCPGEDARPPSDRFVMLGALLIGCSGLVIVSSEWRESLRTQRARVS
jgi:hypothetical protein